MTSFPDEDALVAAGEEAARGGAPGNRWPRQETLALLKIRSEMDAAFRDATLKAPLWEDVSRKLAELGYKRSAKKCKEKFENVHKYYKRTKDGRVGRQDGKSYRFFRQLEALDSGNVGTPTAPTVSIPIPSPATSSAPNPPSSTLMFPMGSSSGNFHIPSPLNTIPPTVEMAAHVPDHAAICGARYGGISFSDTSSSSASESEEDTEEGVTGEPRKRKRRGGGGGGGHKMMAFFERLMTEVMDRQETMQQKFLETLEKREQERMIREEAWKRQEIARLNREQDMMAQERAISASRDAAIIAYLQKMTGQTVSVPVPVPAVTTAPPVPQPPSQQQPPPAPVSPPPPQQTQPPPPQRRQLNQQRQPRTQEQRIRDHGAEAVPPQASKLEVVPAAVPEASSEVVVAGGGSSTDPASSRWPKAEVHDLIKLRSGLETRYQETGPKGPLWEEISARMQRMGYNRSAKRCKEKWENINKYFKKVKESNKQRPVDSKTCPYFHELDALYRSKLLGSGSGGAPGSGSSNQAEQELETNRDSAPDCPQELAATPPPQPPPPPKDEAEGKNNGGGSDTNGDRSGAGKADGNGGSAGTQTRNGTALKSGFLVDIEGTSSGGSVKKPEDIVKELMDLQQQPPAGDRDRSEELHSGGDTDRDCDEDENMEIDYGLGYQARPDINGTSNQLGGRHKLVAAAPAGSFMAMMP